MIIQAAAQALVNFEPTPDAPQCWPPAFDARRETAEETHLRVALINLSLEEAA